MEGWKKKRKKPVEVVEFVDPYIQRRKLREQKHGNDNSKTLKPEPPRKKSKNGREVDESSIFFAKIDKRKVFEEVLALNITNFDDKEAEKLRKQLEDEKLASLGCDVSRKVNVGYKQLQEEIKERKELERKLREQNELSTELANSLLKSSRQLSRFSKFNSSRRRKLAYEKQKRKQQRNVRKNTVLGELDAPKIGKYHNGVLHIKRSDIDSTS